MRWRPCPGGGLTRNRRRTEQVASITVNRRHNKLTIRLNTHKTNNASKTETNEFMQYMDRRWRRHSTAGQIRRRETTCRASLLAKFDPRRCASVFVRGPRDGSGSLFVRGGEPADAGAAVALAPSVRQIVGTGVASACLPDP